VQDSDFSKTVHCSQLFTYRHTCQIPKSAHHHGPGHAWQGNTLAKARAYSTSLKAYMQRAPCSNIAMKSSAVMPLSKPFSTLRV
jgi:hypothetical protein